jgi:DNA-directed RNA polymerase specialized sigma24 family protein
LVYTYCDKYPRSADRDELFSVAGWSFMLAVRYYQPNYSRFTTFFATVAGRRMADLCRKQKKRHKRFLDDTEEILDLTPDRDRGGDGIDPAELLAAIPDPTDRILFRETTGLGQGKRRKAATVGAELGLSTNEAESRYAAAFGRASDVYMREAA